MYDIESFEVDGLAVKIGVEEDGSYCNPRDNDNLGVMVCWHPDYVLGDYQFSSYGDGSNGGGRGAIETRFEAASGKWGQGFRSMEHLRRYLGIMEGAVVILPLYLLDHSGLSMRAGSPSAADPGGWDTTMVGFIYTTASRIRELCGEPQDEGDPFYCADGLGIEVYGGSALPPLTRGEFKGQPRCDFTLRPIGDRYRLIRRDSYTKSGARRIWAVCWHGHYEVMAEIFRRHPNARISSALATYEGEDDFLAQTQYNGGKNIGSRINPQSYETACNCAREGLIPA